MRSLTFVGLTLAFAAAALVLPAAARAQDVEKVAFDTVDQVRLQGLFYPSKKGKKAPVVLMLHKIGGNAAQDGWDKLAQDLQKADYAVLIFDFRGHGNSTTVQPGFWTDRANQENRDLVKGYNKFNPDKSRETISWNDFNKAYYPQLINDITAAKTYLDKRNDSGDCNSSNLILIGAEDGATLGMMWLYAEQMRYRVTAANTNPITGAILNYQKHPTPLGSDVSAAIWLSIDPRLGGVNGVPVPLKGWTKFAGREKNVPLAFVYGEKNTSDRTIALNLLDDAKDTKNKWTGEKGIKDTELRGHGLLSDKVKGRSWILDEYLKKLMEEKAMPVWESKEAKKNGYVWEFPTRAVFAKVPDEDPLRRVPVGDLFKP
jgi:pimeloyl-ACP methyl ester carboxylesterase